LRVPVRVVVDGGDAMRAPCRIVVGWGVHEVSFSAGGVVSLTRVRVPPGGTVEVVPRQLARRLRADDAAAGGGLPRRAIHDGGGETSAGTGAEVAR
jgi:hypothetical protein